MSWASLVFDGTKIAQLLPKKQEYGFKNHIATPKK